MAKTGSKRRPGGGTPLERLHLWQLQAVRDVLFVGSIAGMVWLGYALRAVTVPLLVALLLAYLFEPLVERLSRRPKMTRPMVVGGLLGTVGVLVIALVAILVPLLVAQTARLVHDYQGGQFRQTAMTLTSYLPQPLRGQLDTFIDYLPDGQLGPSLVEPVPEPAPEPDTPASKPAPRGGFVAPGGGGSAGPREERIREIVREELQRDREPAPRAGPEPGAQGDWLGVLKGGARAATALIGGIVRLGFLAFLIPFYFFFFSVWYPSVVRFCRDLIPETNRPRTLGLLRKMDAVVAGFVRGRIVISMIMGVMLAAGWWVCGVPYSIVVGVVVGLFCAVPYLGGIGIPIAVLLLAFEELSQPVGQQMAWWIVLLAPTIWFGFVQFFEGYVLIPLIAGKATNLDPVTILVAVLAGGSIMGIYGMLLAIPVAACLKILATDVFLPQIRAWTSGAARDPLPIDPD